MADDIRATDMKLEHSDERKAYAPPVLRQFGPVSALTQAGTAGTLELMANMNQNRMA